MMEEFPPLIPDGDLVKGKEKVVAGDGRPRDEGSAQGKGKGHEGDSSGGGMAWSELFSRGLRSEGYELQYAEPAMVEGRPVARCESRMVEEEVQYWKLALVGHFIGHRPSYPFVRNSLLQQWKLVGNINIILLDSGFFIFKFSLLEDLERVLETGPWSVMSRPLVLQPWTPQQRLKRISLSTIPIWIRLPNLPFQYWSGEALSVIGSVIGKPLATDAKTKSKERLSFAKICVEVAADGSFPRSIPVYDESGFLFDQEVVYEWRPSCCGSCKVFGHTAGQCGAQKMQTIKKVWKPKIQPPAMAVERENGGGASPRRETNLQEEGEGGAHQQESNQVIINAVAESLQDINPSAKVADSVSIVTANPFNVLGNLNETLEEPLKDTVESQRDLDAELSGLAEVGNVTQLPINQAKLNLLTPRNQDLDMDGPKYVERHHHEDDVSSVRGLRDEDNAIFLGNIGTDASLFGSDFISKHLGIIHGDDAGLLMEAIQEDIGGIIDVHGADLGESNGGTPQNEDALGDRAILMDPMGNKRNGGTATMTVQDSTLKTLLRRSHRFRRPSGRFKDL